MKLRIGIAGTRGIPNQYGGFEQFAACLSKGLAERGHAVTVYSTHHHTYQKKEWNGVEIVHCKDPQELGTMSQFIYDLNCIRDARKKRFNILLILGYTSSSVWGRWYPPKSIILTNMDGMEWKRSKYAKPVRYFLRFAERLAMKFSDHTIADSIAIKQYLEEKYNRHVDFISYGSDLPSSFDDAIFSKYGVVKQNYHLLIARMEPENNIEIILEGLCARKDAKKILVVGNVENRFGQQMKSKFSSYSRVIFAGTVYDRSSLDALRSNCALYFHGHSVGGTNPSLLEAMSCGAVICAHDNVFNRAVLDEDAYWFHDAEDIAALQIDQIKNTSMAQANLEKIKQKHTWAEIINAYEQLFTNAYHSRL